MDEEARKSIELGTVRAAPAPPREVRALLDHISDGFAAFDREWRYTYINASAAALTGHKREQLVGRVLWEVVPELVNHPSQRNLLRAATEGVTVHTEEYFAPLGRWLESRIFPTKSGVVVIVRDVTEHKRTLAALRESEERYRRIVETAREGVWTLDAKNKFTFVNARMAEMLGYVPEEMLGMPLEAFVDDESREISRRNLERRRAGIEEQHEFKFLRKDGSPVWTLLEATPLLGADGSYQGSLAMVTDITARRELEAALRHSQKMEALGRLAGGVAHDFNNLLTVILGYGEWARGRAAEGDPLGIAIDEILKAGHRAAALTSQLLAFGRKQTIERRPVELGTAIRDLAAMLGRLLGEAVDLRLELGPEALWVKADPAALAQVLTNLAVNARDAMPRGGRLTISARPDGERAVVAVRDEGEGMDAATRARIFEPFFTTKPHGSGTGLGLSTVAGIVAQHEGTIDVKSEPGRGSTFLVRLPRCEAPRANPATPAPEPPARGGGESILLVEDDPHVRELTAQSLAAIGYQVRAVGSIAAALTIARSESAIDLVVSDLTMSDGTGLELAAALRSSHPRVAFLLTSGHAEAAAESAAKAGLRFLAKPFRPSTLARAVEAALASPGAGV